MPDQSSCSILEFNDLIFLSLCRKLDFEMAKTGNFVLCKHTEAGHHVMFQILQNACRISSCHIAYGDSTGNLWCPY
jgi:hypothetical protein